MSLTISYGGGDQVNATRSFWRWYERHYRLNLAITLALFLLQLVHLYWLSADVVWYRLTGERGFDVADTLKYVILLVDYTEIPALISTSLVYINELRKGFSWKSVLFLIFLNSQWLHLFWITDEFVVGELAGDGGSVLPVWLAWVAIGIDYLEVPVIVDIFRRFIVSLRHQRTATFLREELL